MDNSSENDRNPNVHLWDEHNESNQQWILNPVGENAFEIVSRKDGLSLDIAYADYSNGTNIRMHEPNSSNAQKFYFISVDADAKQTITDGSYHIVSKLDNNFGLDIAGGEATNETNIQLYSNAMDSRQLFDVQYLGNGYYSIIDKVSGKSLDVYNNNVYNGTNVQLFSAHNGNSQQWIIKDTGDGYYEILSRQKNMTLDVWGGVATNGANVVIHARHGGANQQWKFIPEPQAIRLIAPSTTMTIGKTMMVTAMVTPSNANSTAVTWKSSNPKVATVTNGNITAHSVGNVDITATTVVGNKTAKFSIVVQPNTIPIYRLHHPKTKQYFYTKNLSEVAALKSKQWVYEGKAFHTATSGRPVFRLYNTSRKAYLFTTSTTEKNSIVKKGWKYEGIAWYSAGSKKVYRLFNPKTKTHMYTVHTEEVAVQRSRGWKYEGVTFLTY